MAAFLGLFLWIEKKKQKKYKKQEINYKIKNIVTKIITNRKNYEVSQNITSLSQEDIIKNMRPIFDEAAYKRNRSSVSYRLLLWILINLVICESMVWNNKANTCGGLCLCYSTSMAQIHLN